MTNVKLVHGTAIAIGKSGVLIRGEPGSGKSTLALQLIDQPGYGLGQKTLRARLVADDQVALQIHRIRRQARVMLASPAALRGLLEVRGVGILPAPTAARCELRLLVDILPVAQIERLPDIIEKQEEIMGVSIHRLVLPANLAAAPARLRAVLSSLGRV